MAYQLLGKDFTPPDVRGKVTGRAKYAEDFRAEGMLFAKLLTSPMPHARVRNIETIRRLRRAAPPDPEPAAGDTEAADAAPTRSLRQPCPACGGTMIVIETFDRGQIPRSRAPPAWSAA